MKNNKTLKLFSLIFAVAFIFGAAFCISASAEDAQAPKVEIVAKNLSFRANFYIAYAVEGTNLADGAEIGVRLYAEDPSVNPEAQYAEAAKSTQTYNDNPVFYSYAYPAHKAAEYVYAVPYVKGTDIVGDVIRYSPLQYVKERLFEDTASLTEAQEALYEEFIVFGEKAQAVIAPTATAISSYKYLVATDGTVDGKYAAGLFSSEMTATLNYTGTKTVGYWKLTDASGATSTQNNDVAFAVSADAMATPVFEVYDPTVGVVTETFDGTTLPSTVTTSLKATGSSVAVNDGVVEFYSNNGALDSLTVNRIAPSVDNNRAYTFQADIYLADWKSTEEGATTGNSDALEIKLKKDSDVYGFIILSRDGNNIKLVDFTKNGAYKTSPAITTTGKFFNLRIEWTFDTKSGSLGGTVMKIFIDNELTFISHRTIAINGNDGTTDRDILTGININNVSLAMGSSAEMLLKLDNVKLYSSDKTFVEGEVPAFIYDDSNNIVANPNK